MRPTFFRGRQSEAFAFDLFPKKKRKGREAAISFSRGNKKFLCAAWRGNATISSTTLSHRCTHPTAAGAFN